MKNALIISIFFLTSCITVNTTSTGFKDEIYFSDEDYELNENTQTEIASQEYSDQESEDDSQIEYVDEYSSDDYYDYGYSSRIRRFHSPFSGFGYYHNFYTNSYWYNYNPYNYGVSIYYGYDFWHPNYYSHHHHGYYNNYHSLNDYYYHNSYYAGSSYPTYFNSYDNNSTYYGTRQNYNVQKTPESFANRFVDQKIKSPISTINRIDANKKPKESFNNIRPYNNANVNTNTNSSTSFKKPLIKPQNQNINTRPINNSDKPINNSVKRPSNIKPTINSKPSRNNSNNNYTKPSYNKPKATSVRPSNNSRSPSRIPSRSSNRNNTSRPR